MAYPGYHNTALFVKKKSKSFFFEAQRAIGSAATPFATLTLVSSHVSRRTPYSIAGAWTSHLTLPFTVGNGVVQLSRLIPIFGGFLSSFSAFFGPIQDQDHHRTMQKRRTVPVHQGTLYWFIVHMHLPLNQRLMRCMGSHK
jgi:hypothetical protein